jgi:hypothetical protein
MGVLNEKRCKTQAILIKEFNTIYYNNSITPIFVSISVQISVSGEIFTVYSSLNSNPTTAIITLPVYSYGTVLTFIVIPNYYYKVTCSSNATINNWVEWFYTF